ncbi:MAG: hypothetical protein L6R43_15310 [Planctomycetes bacterium]|nr:hypothetical protein [Planctomycetota bacterium]
MARAFLALLVVLNAVVLLGQVWPEGAPPFARWVNVAFLVLTMARFLGELRRPPRPRA